MAAFDAKILEQRLILKDSCVGLPSLRVCSQSLLSLKTAETTAKREQLEGFLRNLLLVKLEIDKSLNVFENFHTQITEYQILEENLEGNVTKAQHQIDELQQELIRQQQIRKHHILCETEAIEVNKLPNRSYLKRKIADVETRSNNTVQELEQIEQVIERRFEQLLALSSSFSALENKLVDINPLSIIAPTEPMDDIQQL